MSSVGIIWLGIRCTWIQVVILFLFGFHPANAQLKKVVVGITPACPYGLSACWAGAKEGLNHLDGVELIKPDYHNCMAEVELTKGQIPNLTKWAEQFKKVVGQVYGFRGIEITIEATLVRHNNTFVLESPSINQQIIVVPFRNKLQWDFQKSAPKPTTPIELNAFQQVRSLLTRTAGNKVPIIATGPLFSKNNQLFLELRAFSTMLD